MSVMRTKPIEDVIAHGSDETPGRLRRRLGPFDLMGFGKPSARYSAGRCSSGRIESTLATSGQTTDGGAAISISVTVSPSLSGGVTRCSSGPTTYGSTRSAGTPGVSGATATSSG